MRKLLWWYFKHRQISMIVHDVGHFSKFQKGSLSPKLFFSNFEMCNWQQIILKREIWGRKDIFLASTLINYSFIITNYQRQTRPITTWVLIRENSFLMSPRTNFSHNRSPSLVVTVLKRNYLRCSKACPHWMLGEIKASCLLLERQVSIFLSKLSTPSLPKRPNDSSSWIALSWMMSSE